MFHNPRAIAAAALALAAGAAPTASARPMRDPVPTTTQPAVQIVHVTDHPAFDWGDAGLGAAGGFAIAVLGAGGALAVLEIRTRRTVSARASSTDQPTPNGQPDPTGAMQEAAPPPA